MSEKKARGSSNLDALSADGLHKSISAARQSYKIERWWKYGQPAIDRITAVLNVTDLKAAGAVVESLIGIHDARRQVGLDVFPYGIPVIDGLRINVNIDRVGR